MNVLIEKKNVSNPHKLLDHMVSLSSIRFHLMITYYYINCCYLLFFILIVSYKVTYLIITWIMSVSWPLGPVVSVVYSQKCIHHKIFVHLSHLEMATNMRNASFLDFFSNCHNKTMMNDGIILTFKNMNSLNQRKHNLNYSGLGLKIIFVWICPSCMFWSSFYPTFTLDIDFLFHRR